MSEMFNLHNCQAPSVFLKWCTKLWKAACVLLCLPMQSAYAKTACSLLKLRESLEGFELGCLTPEPEHDGRAYVCIVVNDQTVAEAA